MARFGRSSEMVPIRMWLYAAKQSTPNGVLMGYQPGEWRMIFGWSGDVDALIAGLVAIGFLDKLGDNHYKLHDWDEHQGHIISFSERGKKANQIRWDRYREAKKDGEYKQSGPRGVNATPL